MTRLDVTVSHRLSQEEALKRTKSLAEEVKAEFADKINGLREEWIGAMGAFSFLAIGLPVSGTVIVKADSVQFLASLPLAASFFKGKIEAVVRERAAKQLGL